MVSKNNQQWKQQQEAQRVPHYGLRKLSVGVASVLLSTTLYAGVSAQADTVAGTSEQPTVSQPANTSTSSSASDSVVTNAEPATSTSVSVVEQPTSASSNPMTTQPVSGSVATPSSNATLPNSTQSSTAKPAASPSPAVLPTNLAAVPSSSDELVAGKDFTISDVSFQETNDKFTEPAEILSFSLHFDDPASAAGKYIKIQATQPWSVGWERTVKNLSDQAKLSFEGQEIGAVTPMADGLAVEFNSKTAQFKNMDLKMSIPMIAYAKWSRLTKDFYSPSRTGEYTLTKDWIIGGRGFSSNYKNRVQIHSSMTFHLDDAAKTTRVGSGTIYASVLSTPTGETYATFSPMDLGSSGATVFLNIGTDLVSTNTKSVSAIISADPQMSRFSSVTVGNSYDNFVVNYDKDDLVLGSDNVYYKDGTAQKNTVRISDVDIDDNHFTITRIDSNPLATTTYRADNGQTDDVNGATMYIELSSNAQNRLRESFMAQITEALKKSPNNKSLYLHTDINPEVSVVLNTDDGKTKTVSSPDFNIEVLHSWEALPPAGAVLLSATNKTVNVYQHGDQNIPSVVDQNQLTKTVTRTINVNKPGQLVQTVKQTVTFHQSASVVDGTEVRYNGDWKVQGDSQWAIFTPTTVAGYTPSRQQVNAVTVNNQTKDQTVDITYTANPQTTTVVYQAEDGTPVHTTTVNGRTDQTVKVPNETPAGWQVVNGKVPSEITFGPDGSPQTVVTIAHHHVTVTPDAPKTTDDQLPDNPAKTYPSGVGETDLNKTITRTIVVTMPNGKPTTVKQEAKLTRTADVDEVTGNVTYGDWSTDEWAKYDVPTIDYYVPSRATVEAAKVDANTLDQSVTITYKQIAHPSVETATKTLTEHFIYGEGDRQGKVAAPDSQIKLFFKRTNQVTADGTVVSYGQWELDPSQGTNGYQILSGQWQIPTPGNYDVLRAVAELPNGQKLSVDENHEYHYSSSLAWLNPELSAVDYFADPDFYDVRTEHTTYVQAVHVDLVLRDQDPMNVGNPYVGRIHLTGFADDSRNLTWDDIVAAGKHDKMDLANYELVPGQTVTVDFEPQSPDSILVNLQHKHHQVQTVDHVKVILVPALIDNLHGYTAEMWLTLNSQIDQDGRPKKDSYHQVTVAVPVTLTVDAVTQWILNAKVTPTTVNIQESQYANSDLNGHDYGIAVASDGWLSFGFGPDWRQVLAKPSNGHREQLAKLLGVSNDQTLDEAISNSTVETAHFSYPKRNMNGNVQQAVTKNQIVIDDDVVFFPDFSDFSGDDSTDQPHRLYDENNPLTDEVMSFQILNWHFPKPVTRTINMHLPSGKVETTTQVVDAGKTVAFNDDGSLTLESTHGSLEWVNYEVPTQAGYTPSQAVVTAQLVDDQTADQTVDIYYTPNQHQINVEYVDDDDHGKVVKTDQVSGKTDQTITVTPSAPANYDLVDDNNRTYTVTSADGQTVQIHVKHHQVTTTEDKTVTRTINVHTPHDGVKTIKQTAELTREVTTDQVTGEKTYDDWTTGQWESYTPEAVPGYTPSTNEVPNANVDGSTGDQMVDVTYIADAQKVEIVYLDDTKDGAVVKTDQVTGKTDETVKVTPDVPAGYELVGKVPGDYTMTADGHQTITVHLVHQTKTISESKTITRTINVHTPHDGTKTIKQTATLTRDVVTDQVTVEKTYGDWSTTEWDHYAVPAVAGYVPSIEQVAQQVVNGTTTDQTIDVTYSSGEHTTHINYVDGDGNTVHTTTITGQTDGTVQVPNETPAGWTVVGEPVPNELTFGPDGHTDVTVTVDHQHVTVTPDQPKTPTDKLPDNPAKTYPNGVGHDDLNKSITRTLKITTPDGQTKTVEQTAHLTRTADVDEVTGEVTYGKWTTGKWSNYDVPTVPGYTPSQSEVPTTKVTDDTKDQTVTVTYTADDHTTTINYVDQNGKVVHTTVVNGQTDQTVKVPNEVPTGWVVTGETVPDTITFGPDGHDNVTVTIDHQHVTVTPDKPQADGTKLPDNPNQTFHGVAETDLNKLVTRTIEVTTPSGKTNTVKQTAKLTRTANVDEVTGEVTYGKWTTGTWSSYTVPNVAGYTPSQAVVTEVKVDADTTNQTVKITYTADSHTTHINYVTKDGKVAHTTTVTGATGQTVKVPNETPAGWTITTGEVPSEVTFGANGHGDVTVTIAHQTVTVTPDQPQTNGTQLPDNPTLTFHGVGEGDLNRTVTRTITLNVPGQVPQVITQTVRLTRTATVDEVTGEVIYGDWTTGQWDAYEVPTVDGYTADQTTIPAVEVTSATTSQEMVINYTAVPTTPSNHQPDAKQATTATPNTPLQTPVTKAQKLPQTGETQNVLAPIGLALLGILSSFSLFAKKRKAGKDDKHQS